MEQQYQQIGVCTDNMAHLYEVSFYEGEKTELHVYLRSDGSVCKNGRHYARTGDAADKDLSADLEKWSDFMRFDTEK